MTSSCRRIRSRLGHQLADEIPRRSDVAGGILLSRFLAPSPSQPHAAAIAAPARRPGPAPRGPAAGPDRSRRPVRARRRWAWPGRPRPARRRAEERLVERIAPMDRCERLAGPAPAGRVEDEGARLGGRQDGPKRLQEAVQEILAGGQVPSRSGKALGRPAAGRSAGGRRPCRRSPAGAARADGRRPRPEGPPPRRPGAWRRPAEAAKAIWAARTRSR